MLTTWQACTSLSGLLHRKEYLKNIRKRTSSLRVLYVDSFQPDSFQPIGAHHSDVQLLRRVSKVRDAPPTALAYVFPLPTLDSGGTPCAKIAPMRSVDGCFPDGGEAALNLATPHNPSAVLLFLTTHNSCFHSSELTHSQHSAVA